VSPKRNCFLLNLTVITWQSKRQHCFAAPLSKDEVRSGKRLRRLKKNSSLTNSPPTRGARATEQFSNVANEQRGGAPKLIQPLQSNA
jgi:hypothetical protein